MILVSLFDRLTAVREYRSGAVPAKRPAKRSVVVGQSSKARARLLKLLAMVNRCDPALFVTLTFHDNVTSHDTYAKAHNRWLVNVRERFPALCGVWRLAPQRRGAAHYHFLLWGLPTVGIALEQAECYLRDAWLSATGQHGDRAAVRHAVDVSPVGDFRACGFYLALYQSNQASDGPELRGRTWGVVRRGLLDLRPSESFELTEAQSRYLRRVLRTASRKRRGVSCRGFAATRKRGPLARAHGGFSAFLPLHVSTRLLRYVTGSGAGNPRPRSWWVLPPYPGEFDGERRAEFV